jgi:hypothetical protein
LLEKLGAGGFFFGSNSQKAKEIWNQIVYHQISGSLRAQARIDPGQANQEEENHSRRFILLCRPFAIGRHFDESPQTQLTAEGHWDNR